MDEYLAKKLNHDFYLFSDTDKLNYENVYKIKPKMIFFPFWSNIIPEKIYKNFEENLFFTQIFAINF